MLQSTFTWLATRPPDNVLEDLVPLRRHLLRVVEASLRPMPRLELFALFQDRIDAADRALRPRLLEARLPLPDELRRIAAGLIDLRGILAVTLLRTALEAIDDPLRATAPDRGALAASILRNLAEQQQVALSVATATPVGLWLQVQRAFAWLTAAPPGTDIVAAERILKGMLALAAARPEALTARGIDALVTYLREFADAVSVTHQFQPPPDGWFWLQENQDLPPMAMVRRVPPAHVITLYFSCTALAEVADRHLQQLNETSMALPGFAAATQEREILTEARRHWQAPAKRQSSRRASHYRVEICAPFDQLWQMLDHEMHGAGDSAQQAAATTEWQVLNESAKGYAMMHVSGVIDDLVAGDIVGVRTAPEQPWIVCLLRWGRSDSPAHIEIGLELVAPGAIPVKLIGHGADGPTLAPSLLLLSKHSGADGESLFIERDRVAGNRFTLMDGSLSQVRLSECEVQRLVLQTSTVEKLEFRRDYEAF